MVRLTGHCVMGRHVETMQLPSNDFYGESRPPETEDTVIHFFDPCQLNGVINIKNIAAFIQLLG